MIKKFEGGSIEYRLPNYAETQILLGEIGFGIVNEKDNDIKNQDFIIMGKILKYMGEFITAIKIDKITSYDELLNSSVYAPYLQEISVELINKMMDFTSKKKSN